MEPYKASLQLEQAIREAAPPYYATNDAPSTWCELLDWSRAYGRQPGDPIPVYSGGCERTIYSSPDVNHAFRAWHDKLHIMMHMPFDVESEGAVCDAHVDYLYQKRNLYGITPDDMAAMTADVKGQIMYYAKHRCFVENQALFVAHCMARGIHAVVNSGEEF